MHQQCLFLSVDHMPFQFAVLCRNVVNTRISELFSAAAEKFRKKLRGSGEELPVGWRTTCSIRISSGEINRGLQATRKARTPVRRSKILIPYSAPSLSRISGVIGGDLVPEARAAAVEHHTIWFGIVDPEFLRELPVGARHPPSDLHFQVMIAAARVPTWL